MQEDSDEEEQALLERAAGDDPRAVNELLDRYRNRLRGVVRLRLDPRINRRFDESDVVQEALIDASVKIGEFVRSPDVPFYLWLRQLTLFKVTELHRLHLTAQRRDVRKEIPLKMAAHPDVPPASSIILAEDLVADLTSPSQAVMKAELHERIEQELEMMEPADREILVLRHFEQLSIAETAQVLGISKSGAAKSYVRAIKHLRSVMHAAK